MLELAILGLLKERAMHGYQLSKRLADTLGAFWKVSYGSLYPALKRLEREGLAVAQPYSERPPRYVYELTAAGAELAGALRLLAGWGARHGEAEPVRHEACGSPLEARWYCPTCEESVEDPAEAGVHFA